MHSTAIAHPPRVTIVSTSPGRPDGRWITCGSVAFSVDRPVPEGFETMTVRIQFHDAPGEAAAIRQAAAGLRTLAIALQEVADASLQSDRAPGLRLVPGPGAGLQ